MNSEHQTVHYSSWATASNWVVNAHYFSFRSFYANQNVYGVSHRSVCMLLLLLLLLLEFMWRFKINSKFSFDSQHLVPRWRLVENAVYYIKLLQINRSSNGMEHPTENQIRENHTDARTLFSMCFVFILDHCWRNHHHHCLAVLLLLLCGCHHSSDGETPTERRMRMFWIWTQSHSDGNTIRSQRARGPKSLPCNYRVFACIIYEVGFWNMHEMYGIFIQPHFVANGLLIDIKKRFLIELNVFFSLRLIPFFKFYYEIISFKFFKNPIY